MDRWRALSIGFAHHVFCNPLSGDKVDELVELLRTPERGRLLDIACGKGEFLCRAVQRWNAHGVGVDLSPMWAPEARLRAEQWGLGDRVEIVQLDAASYEAEPASFDATACLGASWIFRGYSGTLDALARWTRPGGAIAIGEPFWVSEPSPAHLDAADLERSSFGTHAGNVETGTAKGLSFLHAIVSSHDDWDRYEGMQWNATERYARDHPDDPDLPELLDASHRHRARYLRWARAELGWASYLFLKP